MKKSQDKSSDTESANVPHRPGLSHALQGKENITTVDWRRVVANIPDPIARFNRRFEFVFVNRAFMEMTGFTGEDIIGKTNAELATLPEGVTADWMNLLKKVFDTGEPGVMKAFYPSGEDILEMMTRVIPEFDAEGNIESVLAIGRDITQLHEERDRRADSIIKQYEEKYAAIFENIDAGIIVGEILYDDAGKPADLLVHEANARFSELMQFEEPAGKKATDIFRSPGNSWLPICHHVVTTGQPQRFENYTREPPRWCEWQMFRVGDATNGRLAIVVYDISALRRLEEWQQYMLKLIDALRPLEDPIAIEHLAMKLLGEQLAVMRSQYWEVEHNNEWLVSYGGYTNGVAPIIGRVRMDDFGLHIKEIFRSGKTLVVEDGLNDNRVNQIEKASYTALGFRGYIGVPIVNEERLAAVIAVQSAQPRQWTKEEVRLVEETAHRTWEAVERAKAGKALKDVKESLELVVQQRSKEIILKNRQLEALHTELQTFNNIAANHYTETLRQLYTNLEHIVTHDARHLSDSGRANIRRAQSAVQKMKLLTEDLLSYSQIQHLGSRLQDVELSAVLQTVIADRGPGLQHTHLKVTYIPTFVAGYPLLLPLLFYHLLDNAIKFRKNDEDHKIVIYFRHRLSDLELQYKEAQPNIQYHMVSVSDNGIGFPPEQAVNIFQIFHRLHDKSQYKGSGIGLAVCKKIMDLHGGFIIAEGEEGSGASFHCYFPVIR